MKKELTIVTVTYSFDPEVVAIVFDDYKKACDSDYTHGQARGVRN